MQDRPTASELLDAIEAFLRDRASHEATRYDRFQLTVASNSLAILRRELESDEAHSVEEWQHLDALLKASLPVPPRSSALTAQLRSRYDDLCDRIELGEFDDDKSQDDFINHFLGILENRVSISNPRAL